MDPNLIFSFVAQVNEVEVFLGKVVGIMQVISMALAFIGMIVAAFMIMTGRNEYVAHILIGCIICAMAWILITAFFGAAGVTTNIDPTTL